MSIVLPKLEHQNTKPIKGRKYVSELYPNIGIVARKKSGKTVVIFNLIKHIINGDCRVIIICPTFYKDATYAAIRTLLDKKGIEYEHHNEIGTVLEDFVRVPDELEKPQRGFRPDEELEEDPEDELEEDPQIAENVDDNVNENSLMSIMFGGFNDDTYGTVGVLGLDNEPKPEPDNEPKPEPDNEPEPELEKPQRGFRPDEKPKRKRKFKYAAPETLIIMDDLGEDCKHKSVYKLLMQNRHHKCAVIMSVQYPNNLTPNSWKQIDQALLFRGHNDKKLKELCKNLDCSVSLEEFIRLYKIATAKKYAFLNYDKTSDEYLMCFKKKLNVQRE